MGSGRIGDGVDFCAKTFDASPVYLDDAWEGVDLGAILI